MLNQIPPLTRTLIFINVAVYLAQQLLGDLPIIYLALWPLETLNADPRIGGMLGVPSFFPWQLITYSFLHGSLTHLLFNMFALYMFGGDLERVFGVKRFLSLYFAAVITAAFAQLLFSSLVGGPPRPTVGASGGVFGVLLAFGLYFPFRTIVPLIPPIPMPAWVFVTLYGLLELVLGVTGTQDGVAHFAHLGGMLGAGVLILYWRGHPPFNRGQRR